MENSRDKALKLANEINTDGPVFRPEQGIKRVSDVRKNMTDTFHKGKERGITSGFQSMDSMFSWKKGYMYCITGYPGHGKSEIALQMMLIKSVHDGWRWAIYSPENYPVDELYDNLIHSYIGKTLDPRYAMRMTETEYNEGMDFIGKHFVVIDPIEDPTPELILKYLEYLIKNERIDGCLIDPWNQMIHPNEGREDLYLSNEFTKVKRFTRKYNQHIIITAHSRTPNKNQDGSLPAPDQYSLSGGAMWNNKFDVIGSIFRANLWKDPKDTNVVFTTHKIKSHKLVGIPGSVELYLKRGTNRYYELNGTSPLEGVTVKEDWENAVY